MAYGDDHHPDLAHPLDVDKRPFDGIDIHKMEIEADIKEIEKMAVDYGCRADRDGECTWDGCPQIRDNEPSESGRHCPRDMGGRLQRVLTEVTMDNNVKDTNPKDAVGIKKAPISTVSGAVIAELGIAMLEGARKYGRHNYRVSGVRASVYRDAAWRHLNRWWEGEDDDPDSGLSHITKAIASLFVLRDAMIFKNWTDDRPPPVPEGFFNTMDELTMGVIKKYPNAKDAFTHEDVK